MGGNGRTLHSQLYVRITQCGPLLGGRWGTYYELIPAVAWGFLTILFGGVVVVFKLRDFRHGVPPTQHPSQLWATEKAGASNPHHCDTSPQGTLAVQAL